MVVFKEKQLFAKIEELTEHVNKLEKKIASLDTKKSLSAVDEHVGVVEQKVEKLFVDANMLAKFDERVKQIDSLTKKFEKRVNGLQSFDSVMLRSVTERVEKALAKKVAFLDGMYTHYKELEGKTKDVHGHIGQLMLEVKKFTAVASKIKEQDFVLREYSKNVDRKDKEIRQLERENERLKMMIAKRRRSSH